LIKIKVDYRVKVIDNKTGKIVKTVKGKSKTFNMNFARLLGLLFQRGDATGSVSLNDTGGAARTFYNNYSVALTPLNLPADAGNKLVLKIGSSSAAFDRSHYEMQTLLATFAYSTFTLTDTGTNVRVDISGSWINTGASITVREIGFVVRYVDTGGYVRSILLARDIITDTVVGTNQTIAVAYSITIPF